MLKDAFFLVPILVGGVQQVFLLELVVKHFVIVITVIETFSNVGGVFVSGVRRQGTRRRVRGILRC